MERIAFQSEGQALQGAFYEAAAQKPAEARAHAGKSEPARAPCAVILCHGAFEDGQNWSAYARRLAEQGFAVFVPDFVGHGGSGGQRGLVSLRLWAYNIRDAMTALEQRGFRRFALVGWDSGGSAALLAAAHDRRLACAVVLAAPWRMVPPLGERAALTLASGASGLWKRIKKRPLTFSRVQALEKQRFAVDDQADAAYKASQPWRDMLSAVPIPESLDSVWVDISKAVPKIKTPVLVVHGQADAVVPPKQSEKLHALLPGAKKLCLIEDSGHALHLDHKKDEVFVQVARWIKHHLT